jgi:hypothetical protein
LPKLNPSPGTRELTDGHAYKFEEDQNLDKLREFIKTERMYCDFFTFQIAIDENVGRLTISGPEAAKAFLNEEVDLLLNATT